MGENQGISYAFTYSSTHRVLRRLHCNPTTHDIGSQDSQGEGDRHRCLISVLYCIHNKSVNQPLNVPIATHRRVGGRVGSGLACARPFSQPHW